MTKHEQIEEMAKLLWNSPVKCPYDFAECPFGLHKKFTCNCCNMATALYNAGYRKVLLDTENGYAVDVVQYAPWQLIKGYTEREVARTRKETAKEIINEIKRKYGKSCSEYYPLLIEITSEELDDIAKQYGVEVEE